MDFKKTLTRGAMRLLEDPRVRKLAQDPRVWRGVATAWNVRSELTRNFDEHARRIANELGLATPSEVEALKRTIAELEDELRRAREREEAVAAANAPPTPRKAAPKAKRKRATKTKAKTASASARAATDQSPRRRARRADDRGTEPPPG